MSNLLNRLGRTTALIVASGFVAYAAGDGALSITVTDNTGKPLAGATVTISSDTQIGGPRSAVSDASGKVRFVRLSPGQFKVVVTAQGYQTQTSDRVQVFMDQTASVATQLATVGQVTVEVVGTVAQVDVTAVTQGTQITTETLENLPVGRSQLSALTLAPGVVSIGGNPSLAAGLNRDNNGNNGARNNTYIIDGIDVTSPESGTLRTSIAPELIQVQDVKTGAITAEYSARAGLFSNASTKVGGNEFSGGVTLALSPASMQAKAGIGRFDVAGNEIQDFTFWAMGPIFKDKLWFVASYQYLKDTSEVALASSATTTPGEKRTGVNSQGFRFFTKLTWQPTAFDTFDITYNNNPYHFDNLSSPSVLTRRATRTDQGGDRYLAHYGRQFGSLYLDLRLSRHNERNWNFGLSTADGPQNTIRSTSPLTALQAQLGNSSAFDQRDYRKDNARLDLTWVGELLGQHTLKAGIEQGSNELTQLVGIKQGDSYESFDVGTYTWGLSTSPAVTMPSGNIKGSKQRILTAINNSAALKAAFVTAGFTPTGTGGDFILANLNNYTFNEVNPVGGYFSYRFHEQSLAAGTPKMETAGFYVQDQWQIGRLTLSPGFRVDTYKFKADSGQVLFDTGNNFAPRVGLTYDVLGNGKSKFYAYFGKYIDPIKLDMVRFTGSLTSSVRTEDVRMLNQWITYNVRGSKSTVDAVFADTFKLPKTDELRIGYNFEFGGHYIMDMTYTRRRDYDIVEDWDPVLYTDPNALDQEARDNFAIPNGWTNLTQQQRDIISRYRALAIDPNYFAGGGFTGLQNVERVRGKDALGNPTTLPGLNFVLANLPGGERKFTTMDFTLTRREANHWGGFASLSFIDAKGNSQSSGNADFQGDLAKYDPRLPYTNGKLEGSLDYMFKANAYYRWDMGLMLGLTYNMNSGYHYSRGEVASGRVLQVAPSVQEAFSNQLGKYRTPEFNQLDARVQYNWKLSPKVKSEIYVDIINVMNRQEATDLSEGLNTRSGTAYGVDAALPDQPYGFQAPRRLNFGVRVKF